MVTQRSSGAASDRSFSVGDPLELDNREPLLFGAR